MKSSPCARRSIRHAWAAVIPILKQNLTFILCSTRKGIVKAIKIDSSQTRTVGNFMLSRWRHHTVCCSRTHTCDLFSSQPQQQTRWPESLMHISRQRHSCHVLGQRKKRNGRKHVALCARMAGNIWESPRIPIFCWDPWCSTKDHLVLHRGFCSSFLK